MVTRRAAALVFAVSVAGCGSFTPSPAQVVENYLNTIAEGSYGISCTFLDPRTRDSLVKAIGSRDSCAAVFARCLPNEATKLKRDQTQLFYVNVQSSIVGSRAKVQVSGTLVANQVRRVTLVRKRGSWRLTSAGEKLEACGLEHARHRHRRR